MKKGIILVAALAILALIAGCGGAGAKYADVKALLGDQLKAMNDFNAAIDKAANADDMAKSIDKFTASIKGLSGKMKDMEKKYPELASATSPPELKTELDGINKAGDDMQKVLMKKAQYMTDPKVTKAFEDMSNVMKDLGL